MMLATARSLVARAGFDVRHMGETLSRCVQRAQGPAAIAPFRGADSFSNSAASRMAPIAVLYHRDPHEAAEMARRAAGITHEHPIGQDGAALHTAAMAELMRLPPGDELDAWVFVDRLGKYPMTRRFRELLDELRCVRSASKSTIVHVLGNGAEAHRSVPTALHAFLCHSASFADAVLFALSLGGDADSIACMTGALAGASLGASRIPEAWASGVDGRDEIIELADRLLELTQSGGS